MGCFLACFSISNRRKSQKHPNKIASGDQIVIQDLLQRQEALEALQPTKRLKEENIEDPINTNTESKDKHSNIRKKVTFDLNVKTFEELSSQQIFNCLVGSEKGKERGNNEQTENEGMVPYPPNHRYHNCTTRSDECEDMQLEESDSDGDDDDHVLVHEESSESLFSLSIESGKHASVAEMGENEVNSAITICGSLSVEFRKHGFAAAMGEEELNSPIAIESIKQDFAVEKVVNNPVTNCGSPDEELKSFGLNQNTRDRSQYVHSVLSPIENLTQWKAVNARTIPPLKHQEKENINLEPESNIPFSEEHCLKLSIHNLKQQSRHLKAVDQEIGVDTSLSSWLAEPEMTPAAKNGPNSIERVHSSRSYENRPILGALSVDEHEIPVIGTVGSYWSHTGQTMDSSSKGMSYTSTKYKEGGRVNWESTPFEKRLERSKDTVIVLSLEC